MRLLTILTAMLLAVPVMGQEQSAPTIDLLVSADWVAGELGAGDLVILHVADDADDYNSAHLPGSVFLDLAEIVESRDGLLNMKRDVEHLQETFESLGVGHETRVVAYGNRDGLAATRTFMTLDVLGHPAVAILDGGLQAWIEAGYPVASAHSSATRRAVFSPEPREGRFAWAHEIAARLGDDEMFLLDARPPEEFSGDDPGTDIERPGHIPGAVNLFWRDGLGEDGRYIPLDQLAERWRAAGITSEVDLIVYCRTGMQASHAYFTARLLGYEPVVYDPSFHEWSNLTDHPVARIE